MLKFGLANNFSGNIGERALKGIVKDHAEKTQRQPGKFEEQCATCKYESNDIDRIHYDRHFKSNQCVKAFIKKHQ